MHSKILMRTLQSDPQYGWVYAGSHNLSSSAWGRFLATGGIQINNYEIGVLLVAPPGSKVSLKSLTLPFTFPPRKYNAPDDKPWVIQKKSKIHLGATSFVKLYLYVLPQKHIFLPTVEAVKKRTEAELLLPPQPCINVARFGACKYGDTCRYSHTFFPVEIKGHAKGVFEACRMVMDSLTMNSFSMGATLFLNEATVVINGWIWKMKEQSKFTMFTPDQLNPVGNQYNVEVLFLYEPENMKIQDFLTDLCFLSGAGVWVCSGDDLKHETKKGFKGMKGTEGTPAIVYFFGTKKCIKIAASEIFRRLKLNPQEVTK